MEMSPEMSPMEERGRHGFPTTQPTEALKKDHDFVRKLFDRYFNTQDTQVKHEAGTRVLSALDMHMSLEEAVFYPKVRSLDPSLVDHSGEEHQQARQMVEKLQGMNIGDAQCDPLFRQLADAVLHHIEQEEQQLFPKVQNSNLDLEALGIEMQAWESNVVSSQARASEQSPMRK